VSRTDCDLSHRRHYSKHGRGDQSLACYNYACHHRVCYDHSDFEGQDSGFAYVAPDGWEHDVPGDSSRLGCG
jgi:hypothetical protein